MPHFLSHHPRAHLTTTPHHPPPSIPTCWTKSLPSIRPPKPFTMPSHHRRPDLITPTSSSSSSTSRTRVICMARPRRVKMVAKQIQRELSDMLLTDKVLKVATSPEAGLGADRYLSSITTVTDVEISSDLQVVKVYVSVFGDERGKEVAIAGLKAKAKYVRGQLGKRMSLRRTPEVRFIEDESMERGSRIISILDELKREREAANPQATKQAQDEDRESSDLDEDDEDWDDDDDDDDDEEEEEEDIIYVE